MISPKGLFVPPVPSAPRIKLQLVISSRSFSEDDCSRWNTVIVLYLNHYSHWPKCMFLVAPLGFSLKAESKQFFWILSIEYVPLQPHVHLIYSIRCFSQSAKLFYYLHMIIFLQILLTLFLTITNCLDMGKTEGPILLGIFLPLLWTMETCRRQLKTKGGNIEPCFASSHLKVKRLLHVGLWLPACIQLQIKGQILKNPNPIQFLILLPKI